MKKSTINKILFGVIAFLVVAICILVVKIETRPRFVNVAEKDETVITEVTVDNAGMTDGQSDEAEIQSQEITKQVPMAKTVARVNIRSTDSEDGAVLETVEAETEFEVIEVQSNGWTKIMYQEQEAFISSAYIVLIQN